MHPPSRPAPSTMAYSRAPGLASVSEKDRRRHRADRAVLRRATPHIVERYEVLLLLRSHVPHDRPAAVVRRTADVGDTPAVLVTRAYGGLLLGLVGVLDGQRRHVERLAVLVDAGGVDAARVRVRPAPQEGDEVRPVERHAVVVGDLVVSRVRDHLPARVEVAAGGRYPGPEDVPVAGPDVGVRHVEVGATGGRIGARIAGQQVVALRGDGGVLLVGGG